MRFLLATTVLSITLLNQVWGKNFLVETKDKAMEGKHFLVETQDEPMEEEYYDNEADKGEVGKIGLIH